MPMWALIRMGRVKVWRKESRINVSSFFLFLLYLQGQGYREGDILCCQATSAPGDERWS